MKAYRLTLKDGTVIFDVVKDWKELNKKYDLTSKKHISTKVMELNGEMRAIAFSNLQ